MALTTGKKQTQVTPSSIASRMGVVPTYSGDWLATASESIGNALDVQTKRIATMEEEKWKAQFSIDSYKAINDFAMDNRVNPNGFTKNVDSYVSALVNQVPERYKGWAKQYVGMMAAREGQQIINRHYNKQQADLIKLNDDDTNVWLSNTIRHLETTDYKDYDNEMLSSVLAEFTEKSVAYENMYNALDPQYAGALDHPSVWKRKRQIAFEGARLNSKNRSLLESAQVLDQEFILRKDLNGDGTIFEPIGKADEKTNVEVTLGLIKKNMKEYLENPDVDNLDGFSTLLNTTDDERISIQQNALTYVDNIHTQMTTEQLKIKNAITQEYNTQINKFLDSAMKPYTAFDEATLTKNLNGLNATVEDREAITNANKKSIIIGGMSKILFDAKGDTDSIIYKNVDLKLGKYNRTWNGTIGRIEELLLAEGIPRNEIDRKEIKNLIIEQHVYDMTGRTSNTLSFEYDFKMMNNELVADESSGHFFQLKQYAMNMGVVPPVLTEYISSNLHNPLNLDVEGNRDTLIEIAGMLNSLQEIPSVNGMGIEGVSNEDQMLLAEFYKDYKSYRENTSGGIIEGDFIKNWFQIHNDYKLDEADGLIEVFNEKLSLVDENILANQLQSKMEMAAISVFGVNMGTNVGTGILKEPAVKPLIDVPLLRHFVVTDQEKEQLQMDSMVEELLDRLPQYMISYYSTRGKPITKKELKIRTGREIQNDINEIIKFALSDLNGEGYGFE